MEVNFDRKSLLVDGKRKFIFSGSLHYYRHPSAEVWRDRLRKIKALGMNAVDIYFYWSYHSPAEGQYDFSGPRDVDRLLDLIEEEGLYLIARPGPYICSEVDGGGFPGSSPTGGRRPGSSRRPRGTDSWARPPCEESLRPTPRPSRP